MIGREAFVELCEDLRWSTPRLLVRRLEPEDEPTQIDHELNPEIMGFIRDPLPREEVVERVKQLRDGWRAEEGQWLGLGVTERGEERPVGFLFFRVLSYADESVEVGYRLNPDVHGRGYTTEAMVGLVEILRDRARVHKVVASCVAENRASWRVMEKLGMQREGRLRHHSRLAGRWRDELVYGLVFDAEPD